MTTRQFTIQSSFLDENSQSRKLHETKKFTITKRIAKHGNQSIIVIPRLIEEHLKPGTIVELKIEIIGLKQAV
jgi:hypothetical protein